MDVAHEVTTVPHGRSGGRSLARGRSLAWLGVVPFAVYTTVFLLLPAAWLAFDAFRNDAGVYTFDNVRILFQDQYRNAFLTSIKLSLITACAGGIFGYMIAYAATREGTPRWMRPAFMTFSGVAANFAGVPLAFAFVATLSSVGVVTIWLKHLGLDIYGNGFTLFGFTGLALTYVYFQVPLMILVIAPSLDGMKTQWREAATNLGASPGQFWKMIGLPILFPSLMSAMVLLFGNAFSAYATAYALTSGQTNIVPVLIGRSVSGDLPGNTHLADALAVGMIVVIMVTVFLFVLLQRRSNRWLR